MISLIFVIYNCFTFCCLECWLPCQ